jgi:two-component system response regulator YesN
MASPEPTVAENGTETALLISPEEQDHHMVNALFERNGWALRSAECFPSASAILQQTPISIVVTERDLPFGNWKDVLEASQHLRIVPLIIVISRFADDYLWAEALNLGVYDVLLKPLEESEVVRVLTSAWIRVSPNQPKAKTSRPKAS